MSILFEWNPDKARKNNIKHDVTFQEAATVFLDNLNITFEDPDHSSGEDRFVTMGTSSCGRFLVIAHTDRNEKIRIISAREMTRSERQYYEENR